MRNRTLILIGCLILLLAHQGYGEPTHISSGTWSRWSEVENIDRGGFEKRADLSAGVMNGVVYAVGGTDGFRALSTLRFLDPKTGVWRDGPPMPTPRSHCAAAVNKGILYVIGGAGERNSTKGEESGAADSMGKVPLDVVEAFDPATNRWSAKAPLPTPRYGLSVASVNGMIFAVGGRNQRGVVDAVDAYDPGRDAWVRKASLPFPVMSHDSIGIIDGILYVIGGNTGGGCLNKVQAYNPNTDSWKTVSVIPVPGCNLSVVTYRDSLKIFGALYRDQNNTLSEVLTFTPKTEKWQISRYAEPDMEDFAVAYAHGAAFFMGGTSGGNQRTGLREFDLGEGAEAEAEAIGSLSDVSSDIDNVTLKRPTHSSDFALIVGIQKYRGIPEAEFAARDAKTFREYAESALGVPKQNIILLLNDKASKADLAKYIQEWLPRNVTKDSRVFFYFSGHGAPDPSGENSYLVPWDGDPAYLKTRAYSLSALYQQLGSLPAKDVVAFVDACFSGTGPRSVAAKGLRPLVTVRQTPVPLGGNLTVLTAASSNEVAGTLENQGHGMFTYFALKGIQRNSEHLSVRDLYDYVHRRVPDAAHRQNREQDPQLFSARPDLPLY